MLNLTKTPFQIKEKTLPLLTSESGEYFVDLLGINHLFGFNETSESAVAVTSEIMLSRRHRFPVIEATTDDGDRITVTDLRAFDLLYKLLIGMGNKEAFNFYYDVEGKYLDVLVAE